MINIIEKPWLLLIIAGVAALAIIILGSFFEKYKWRLWLLPLIIAASAFAFDYFFETDNEKINSVIAKTVKAAEQENIPTIESVISVDYHDSFNLTKQGLIERCRMWLNGPIIEKNVYRIISLQAEAPGASAVFTVRVVFDPHGPINDFLKMMVFKFDAEFVKIGDDWFFSRIEMIEPSNWQNMQSSLREAY